MRSVRVLPSGLVTHRRTVATSSTTGVTVAVRVVLKLPTPPPMTRSSASRMTVGFFGSPTVESLMDFNPAVNALRLIGSNDQNFAVVNANGGNLNQTAVQTALAYAPGDANAGRDPNVTAGAYNNNVPNTPQTIFYMIDYDLDTLVTIAPPLGARGSNTGGGQLRTIGPLTDAEGRPINFAPTAGLDIYTNGGSNVGVAVSGQTLYCIGLDAIDPTQPVGTPRQKIVAEQVPTQLLPSGNLPPTGGFIDVAVAPVDQPVANNADLAVKAVGPTSTFDRISLVFTVVNQGPSAAKEVTLTGTTPRALAGLRLSASSSQGLCESGTTGGLPSFTCKTEALASQASIEVLVSASYTSPVSRPILIDVDAIAKSAVNDPVPDNNQIRARVVANPVPPG